MKVSDFPIGRGEIYIERGFRRRFVEVCRVHRGVNGQGRAIAIADHDRGRRVPGTDRLIFSATSFLQCYRPATVGDFPEDR